MKKIFGFIGSPLKENSNTYNLTRMMLDRLVELDGGITYELLTAGHVKLDYCKGCWSCMTRGICPQDKNDDMAMLKQKMLDADFIIWGSPVYTMGVSGQMKTFFDRLASWYHMMRNAGKAGITVVTTASQGIEEVQNFLMMLLCATGVKIVGNLDTIAYMPKTFANREEAEKKARALAEEVLPYLTGETKVETDEYLEMCFNVSKNKVINGEKFIPADYKHWQERGMLGMKSFAEVLEKMRA